MRHLKRLYVPLIVLIIYVLLIIFIPIIGKANYKYDRYHIIYSKNIIDDDLIDYINQNRFIAFIDYEEGKEKYYKKYKDLEVKLYLNIYCLTDLLNYDSAYFDGIFIKDSCIKDEVIDKYTNNGVIWLLSNEISDITTYKNKVNKFVFTKDIINSAISNYSDYFYLYDEGINFDESKLEYLKDMRNNKYKYGLIFNFIEYEEE